MTILNGTVGKYMRPLNPFIFSRPVAAADLIDRDEESAQLLALAEGGHAVRLSAPRRYGKTSLLRRLGEEAEKAGMHYVEVDFYGVLSQLDIAVRLEDAYSNLRSTGRNAAVAAIRALRPAVSVGGGPVRVESRPRVDEQTSRLLLRLLDRCSCSSEPGRGRSSPSTSSRPCWRSIPASMASSAAGSSATATPPAMSLPAPIPA